MQTILFFVGAEVLLTRYMSLIILMLLSLQYWAHCCVSLGHKTSLLFKFNPTNGLNLAENFSRLLGYWKDKLLSYQLDSIHLKSTLKWLFFFCIMTTFFVLLQCFCCEVIINSDNYKIKYKTQEEKIEAQSWFWFSMRIKSMA